MLNIVLYEPEIPPNTGNIIRLSANTGFALHLIEPLGFRLDEKSLRRAGLDYREHARVRTHVSLAAYRREFSDSRIIACSTRGFTSYLEPVYRAGDSLLFGPESRGLPAELLDCMSLSDIVRIPMLADSRSLNLSNAVAIVVYEAWRQNGFARHQ